ncbi:GSCFA domain-containing protein [Hymenobacter jeongseonensis]|uniref:GSCFA domain-containing protein n=1 Tax=Hymenobacter jeongseonensis TaxID=2791027 RepID=UPI0021D21D6C|nr:GSCFA domain-containing protein [Hymenobacter jeongseonensis]
MGSCFADSMGSRLAANKVETLVNPFGTVFQPLALARLLRAAAGEEVDWQQHLVHARGRWQSYDLHGSIGADSPVDLLQHIQELVRRTGDFVRQADVVLLTLGTAWAYRLRETGELVNNCHKQAADLFVKELLTPDEIINGLAETHAYLRRINPKLRFVLTVSPVRHLKDTLPLNSVSKSVLRVATHIVSDLLPGVAYFPAYELLVDDLRDYRFYASDMLHPSEVAEEYIWDKFARTYFDADFGRFRKEWAAVRQSLGHRPLHEGTPEHRQFLVNTMEKLEQLNLRKISVAAELNDVRAKIMALPVPQQPEPEAIPEDDEERIDIGEGTASEDVSTPVAQPTPPAVPADGRPPRLSPDEFRAQRAARSGRPERGRRDGRGKGQLQVPSENEQFQVTSSSDNDQVESSSVGSPLVFIPAELGKAEELLEQAAATVASGAMAGEQEPAKKKKRRSRGGAKRTARKNALRLAAGELIPENELGTEVTDEADASNTVATDSINGTQQVNQTSSATTGPESVKRGGRRNEGGRMQRKELFVTAPLPESETSADAESPVLATTLPLVETPAVITEPAAAPRKSRNSRNRGRKGAGLLNELETTNPGVASPINETATAVIGSAEELSGTAETAIDPTRNRNPRGRQPAASGETPVLTDTAAEATTAAPDTTPVPTPARRPNRAKRAVSGARAEKPAMDTPVIPVTDELQLRTQVAAGRMTGSAASLIEPAAQTPVPAKRTPAKKAVPAVKVPASKKPAVKKTATPVPAPEAAPIPAVVEAKPVKKAPVVKKAVAEAKPKTAAKPKAKPTTAAKVPAAKPAAAKPKAPRKPAKPA